LASDSDTATWQFACLLHRVLLGLGTCIRVNDTLTLLFDDDEGFAGHHLAFHVSDAEFDSIFKRIKQWMRFQFLGLLKV
jgi:hypothetical protein